MVLFSYELQLEQSQRELEEEIPKLKNEIKSEEEFLEIYVNLRLEKAIDRVLRNMKELSLKLENKELDLIKVKKSLQEIERKRAEQTRIAIYVSSRFGWYKSQLQQLASELEGGRFYDRAKHVFIESDRLSIELREDVNTKMIESKNRLNFILVDSQLDPDIKKTIFAIEDSKKIIVFSPPSFKEFVLSLIFKVPVAFTQVLHTSQMGIL